ncbi:MAG TPA: thioredoxin family protein [Chloroflexota bacterium]|nr:thioredoxin family protein [Chloroflexota bacterium]
MLERLAVVLLLVLMTVGMSLVIRWRARVRTAAAEGLPLPDALRSRLPADAAGILYFFGPHCGSCRQQAAILDQLGRRERVTVLKLDAVEKAELADAFGIATVPATVVVAPGGTVQTINLGLRSLPVLAGQLRQAKDARTAA